MAETLDNLMRALAQLTVRQSASLAAAVQPQHPVNQAKALTIPIGTRVLDLVTGEKGTVIDGKRANVLISAPR